MKTEELRVQPPVMRGLNREQAARLIGVSPRTFDALVEDGRMPAPKRIGARVLWDRVKIEDAFDALGENEPPSPLDEIAEI